MEKCYSNKMTDAIDQPLYTYDSVFEDGTLRLTGYAGTGPTVEIPSSLNGAPVTHLGSELFANRNDIETIIVPDGVAVIEQYVFFKCKHLKTLFLPKTLKRIGEGAFGAAHSLTDIVIEGDNDTFVVSQGCIFSKDMRWIYACPGGYKGDFHLPNETISVGKKAFWFCENIKFIDLGDGIRFINNDAFGSCTVLDTIIVPKTIEKIGDYAFNGCKDLRIIAYTGTPEEWAKVQKGLGNEGVFKRVQFYSDVEVQDDGSGIRYWHYDEKTKMPATYGEPIPKRIHSRDLRKSLKQFMESLGVEDDDDEDAKDDDDK